MRLRTTLLLALSACQGNVADEMEAALRISNDSLAVALLASEGAALADVQPGPEPTTTTTSPPGTRHGAPTNCPGITRSDQADGTFEITASYGLCVSDSGLVPTTLGGQLILDGSGDRAEVDYSQLSVKSARLVDGAASVARAESEDAWMVEGTLRLPKTAQLDELRATMEILVDHGIEDEVGFDGTIDIDGPNGTASVKLDGVVLHLVDIPGECATPREGLATVGKNPSIEVDYADAHLDGDVVVKRRARTSNPTSLCAFASEVL